MRILIVINSLVTGGAEKLLVDSLLKFLEHGMSVDVFLLKTKESYLQKLIESHDKLKLISGKSKLSVYNPYHIFRLYRHINEYDLIHVHLFPALLWTSLSVVFQLKKKNRCLIYTEHSTTNKRRKLGFLRTIDKLIYKPYDYIIGISEKATKNLQRHLGSGYKNIITIENGVDLAAFINAAPYEKKELGFHENDKLLIQVSSFRYPKDQDTVLRALSKLDNKKVHLLLAGDGPNKKALMRLSEELMIHKNVHFLGVRNDIARLLKTVDVVILSSAYEGLSLSSVEGMAAGKPFIASDVPGLREVIKGAGLLFKYK